MPSPDGRAPSRTPAVRTGASRPAQVRENLKALDVVAKLTPSVMERIDGIVGKPG